MNWRVIFDAYNTGRRNMAVDEAIMLAHGRGETPPTLRLYGWRPPAVSVGYFQNMSKEIDLEACRGLGIDWVRRPTGGRAVLHEHEVTYSAVISERLLPGTVLQTYLALSRGLVEALKLLGAADVTISHGAAKGGSAACFDAPSWYEITCGGRKVVGSAQVRHGGVILQHGSVPIRFDAGRAVSVLNFDSDKVRERVAKNLERGAAGLTDVLGREVSFEEVSGALAGGFAAGLGAEMEPGPVSESELVEALRLENDKYSSPNWNEEKRGRDRDV